MAGHTGGPEGCGRPTTRLSGAEHRVCDRLDCGSGPSSRRARLVRRGLVAETQTLAGVDLQWCVRSAISSSTGAVHIEPDHPSSLVPCVRGAVHGHGHSTPVIIGSHEEREAPVLDRASTSSPWLRSVINGVQGSRSRSGIPHPSERWLPWAGTPPASFSILARWSRFQVMNVVFRLVKSFVGPPEPGSR